MNFYKRYIGDIQRDTGHLSLAEFGAYDRLLDHYYATESALPNDIDACCRIARAMSKDERKSVSSILKQFFTLTDSGYVQGRAEKEISDAQPAMVSARLNGAKGGRPKKPKNETQNKPSGFSENNPNGTQGESSPEPEPYKPINQGRAVENCNSFEVATIASACIAIKREFDLQNKQCIGLQQAHPTLTALIEAGATPQEFAEAARKAAERGKGFGYVLGTMKSQREEVAELKLHNGAMPSTKSSYEQGIASAAKSIFTEENTQHLQPNLTLVEVDHEQRAIAN